MLFSSYQSFLGLILLVIPGTGGTALPMVHPLRTSCPFPLPWFLYKAMLWELKLFLSWRTELTPGLVIYSGQSERCILSRNHTPFWVVDLLRWSATQYQLLPCKIHQDISYIIQPYFGFFSLVGDLTCHTIFNLGFILLKDRTLSLILEKNGIKDSHRVSPHSRTPPDLFEYAYTGILISEGDRKVKGLMVTPIALPRSL